VAKPTAKGSAGEGKSTELEELLGPEVVTGGRSVFL
jgi:hypothetical protein